MTPIMIKKTLLFGNITFWGSHIFGMFLWQNHKKWVPGFGKIPKHGYLFLEKLTLNMGMGLELLAAHPDQSKSEYLPPSQLLIENCLVYNDTTNYNSSSFNSCYHKNKNAWGTCVQWRNRDGGQSHFSRFFYGRPQKSFTGSKSEKNKKKKVISFFQSFLTLNCLFSSFLFDFLQFS